VVIARATICCSVIAFLALCGSELRGQPGSPSAPLFPARSVWTIPLGAPLNAPPLFSATRAYFALGDGRVDAYDLLTSKRLWTIPRTVTTRPALGDGLVFVAERESLLALRESDGTTVWQQTLPEPLAVPIVWDNGWLITASQSGVVAAIRAVDGTVIWQQNVDSPPSAVPALAADRVYVPTVDQRIMALQVKTCELLWTRSLGGTLLSVLAFDDRVYIGSTDNFLYCLLPRDGGINWQWRTGADLVGLPAVDERRLYVVSLDNVLRALDRRSGSQRWLRALPLRPTTGAVRAEDQLIVSGVSPMLRAYAIHDGRPMGQMDAPGDLAAPPHVVQSEQQTTLIVLTRDVAKGTIMTALVRAEKAAAEKNGEKTPSPELPVPGSPR